MESYLVTNDDKNCCSCRACELICPEKCIVLKNERGHFYPYINKNECISCGLCEKVCQYNEKNMKDSPLPYVYSVWHKNQEIVKKSSSGGVFSAIANYGIENQYRIYAAKYDENMNVVIDSADSVETIMECRGAKYVKSDVCDTYECVKKDLQNGLKVIYFGSPCQVGGLKKFLNKEYENLIFVDIICHGMPTQKLFKEYIGYLENQFKSNIKNFYFRYKVDSVMPNIKAEFKNGKTFLEPAGKNMYMKLYNSMYGLMPACTNCLYTDIRRGSDLTIGDFWNLQNIDKNRVNSWGTSIVLGNSSKGIELLKKLEEAGMISLYRASIEEALNSNPQLSRSSLNNPLNGLFMKLLGKISFKKLYILFVVIGNRIMIPYRVIRKLIILSHHKMRNQ